MKNRLVLACSLAALCFAAVIVFLLVVPKDTETPPAPAETTSAPPPPTAAAAPPAQSEEPPAADTTEIEDDFPVPDVHEAMSERDFYEKFYKNLEATRKELFDRLYEIERSTGGGPPVVRMRVSLEDAAEIVKEFIDRFSPTPWRGMLTAERRMLARFYYRLERTEDARKTLETAIAELSEGADKDWTIILWAEMEEQWGDKAVAENLLCDLISAPIPPQLDVYEPALSPMQERARRMEVPLALARIYRKSGRIDEAQMQIDETCRFALSIKNDNLMYDQVAWFYGRAYDVRIDIIFDLADPSDVDNALQEAEKVASEYETNLAAYRRQGSDNTKKYVDDYAKRLRKRARERAEEMKKEAGVSKTADESS